MADESAHYQESAAFIRQQIRHMPDVAIVLGSGLGGFADAVTNAVSIPYETIPHFPQSTVQGHHGRLVIGELEGRAVLVQQGRAHFYEGYSMQQVTYAVRVMHVLGIKTLILTNAAGGVNPLYRVGELMLIEDHINLVGMVGNNPLMGKNDDTLGPRFLGMSRAYDRELRLLARRVAEEANVPMHSGVYMALSGPMFETPAEVRFVRAVGADAVGMSTVHEVVAARHMGMRVLAFSGITNKAIDHVDSENDANHEEVLEAGKVLVPRLTHVLRGVLRELPV